MNKIQNLKREAKCFMNAAICEALNSKVMKYGWAPAVMLGSTVSVFAEGDTLLQSLAKVMGELYAWIVGISTALAVLLIAWNVLKYMAATDPQTALMAKKNAIRVAGAWILIQAMGGVIALMGTLKSNDGTDSQIWEGKGN